MAEEKHNGNHQAHHLQEIKHVGVGCESTPSPTHIYTMITNEIKAMVRTIGIGLFLLCYGFQAFAEDKKADD